LYLIRRGIFDQDFGQDFPKHVKDEQIGVHDPHERSNKFRSVTLSLEIVEL